MSTLGKVFLVFVFLASLGFLYVGARTMKTHHAFRSLHNEYVAALSERDQIIRVKQGEEFERNPLDSTVPKGIFQLERELALWKSGQGQIWHDCAFAARDNGTLSVQVDSPAPHGIAEKKILYVFEQHAQPTNYETGIHANGRPLAFLGEFRVTASAGNRVTLQPTRRLMPTQAKALAESPGPFALYEQLPLDLHAVWQGIKAKGAEKLKLYFDGQMLAAGTISDKVIDEFARDGEKAADGDLDERVLVELKFKKDFADLTAAEKTELEALGFGLVNLRSPSGDPVKDSEGKLVQVDIRKVIQKDAIAYFLKGLPDGKPAPGKKLVDMQIAQVEKLLYVRQLRDYGLMARDVIAELPVLENRIQDLDTHIVSKKDEEAKFKKDNGVQMELNQLFKDDQSKLTAEVAAVTQLRDELDGEAKQTLELIRKLEAENQRLASQIKEAQLREAERINKEVREKLGKTSAP